MLVTAVVLAALAAAEPRPGPIVAADGHVTMTLVAEATTVAVGEPIRVGVRFQMPRGWHMYWKNPGDAGMATGITFRGATTDALQWPAPQRFETSDIVTFGYAEEVVLWTTARFAGASLLEAEIDVLVCEVDCIPASEILRLPIATGATQKTASALFDRWPAPARVDQLGWRASVRQSGSARAGQDFTVELELDCAGACPAIAGAFPERSPGLSLSPEITRTGVRLAGKAGPDATGQDTQVPLTLALRGHRGVEVPLPVLAAAPARAEAPPVAPTPLLPLLALAFLGGLILNLMPCVLPVLAIKVVGFTRIARSGRRGLFAHGLAYTAGALAAMLALAGLVVGLRAAGNQVGWGFQFQEPRFAVAVGALLVAMGLAALGVWRVGGLGGNAALNVVSHQAGLRRSLGEGLLAVVLATPCSAPFLGSAVGAALASPPHVVFLVFAAVGLGLAAPLVLIAFVPGLARLLPRPGAWMETLEHILGFALLAAAVWLAWLVSRVAGADGVAAALAMWLGVALLVFLIGRAQQRERRLRFLVAPGTALLVALLAAAPWFTPAASRSQVVEANGLTWQPWDEAAVRAELAQGRAVFVDFTADWCITCKANEAAVIDSAAVRDAVARHDVALFRADWTRPDERIRAALARHGKAGVPMYLVYSPARPDAPDVLPELLTTGRLVEAFAAARPVSLNETGEHR